MRLVYMLNMLSSLIKDIIIIIIIIIIDQFAIGTFVLICHFLTKNSCIVCYLKDCHL